MTLSPETQRENQAQLLKLLLDATGDNHALAIYETKDPRFAAILPTSWAHLESRGYVKAQHTFGNPSYQFTPAGWLFTLVLTHGITTRGTAERAEKLLRAIKGRVERAAH